MSSYLNSMCRYLIRHSRRAPQRRLRAFTLIELMLVVVILGILAGIVIASMSSPAAQAREATLKGQLRAMRAQIFLYKLQHGDVLPATTTLADVMTHRSDLAGNITTSGDSASYPCGPYIVSFPANPFNGRTDVTPVAANAPIQPDDQSGWLYQVDGAGGFIFVANLSANDSNGKPLSEY